MIRDSKKQRPVSVVGAHEFVRDGLKLTAKRQLFAISKSQQQRKKLKEDAHLATGCGLYNHTFLV